MRVLYTGGARSGKSHRAQRVAERLGERRLFVATAEPLDEDMQARIDRHKKERGPSWVTAEAPLDPAAVIAERAGAFDVVVLDCLTLWVSNRLGNEDEGDRFTAAVTTLTDAIEACRTPLLVVTNEVGLGIVPADQISRKYRDMLGWANQKVAAACDVVVLMVSGLPLPIKGVEP